MNDDFEEGVAEVVKKKSGGGMGCTWYRTSWVSGGAVVDGIR